MEKVFYSLDLETNGLSYYNNDILQLSIVDINLNTVYSRMFKPVKVTKWDNAQVKNSITPEMVQNEKTFDECKDEIITILKQCDLLIGFNIKGFDLPFLEQKLDYKVKCSVMDLMIVARDEFSRYNHTHFNPKLEDVCEWFGVSNNQAHDALADAIATMKIFKRISQEKTKPNLIDIYKFNTGVYIYSKELADKYQEVSGAKLEHVDYYENGKLIEKPTDMSKYRIGNFVKGSKKKNSNSF